MKKLLIVDDDTDLLTSFALFFKHILKGKAKIVTASSAAEAHKHLSRGDISVVLSDINLGGGTGPDDLRKRHTSVPFIYMSGDPTWRSPDGVPVEAKVDLPKIEKIVMHSLGEKMNEHIETIISQLASNKTTLDAAINQLVEVSPPGFSGTTKAMKKHKDISNPYALSWWMYNRGQKPHKTPKVNPKGIKNYIPPEVYASRKGE
jgi:DNA-binding NtrC family response regulator